MTMRREALVQVGTSTFEVLASARADMRVPARIYADEELLSAILAGSALTQLMNVATLPGVESFVYGMPDMHEGYGFPVGGVAATRLPDGVVSPGANRQLIAHHVRQNIVRLFPDVAPERVRVVYDVAHNIARARSPTCSPGCRERRRSRGGAPVTARGAA